VLVLPEFLAAFVRIKVHILHRRATVPSVHPELWTAVPPPTRDPASEAFVQQLSAHVTLKEKVAQMIQADIVSISPAEPRTQAPDPVADFLEPAPTGEPLI
jgi:hypothetical protein